MIVSESSFKLNPAAEINVYQCRVVMPQDATGASSFRRKHHDCSAGYSSQGVDERLSPLEARFLWHVTQSLDLRSVASVMDIPVHDAQEIAEQLCQRNILYLVPHSDIQGKVDVDDVFSSLPGCVPICFSEIWESALAKYGDKPLLHWLGDNSELTADEVEYLVEASRGALRAAGFLSGSRIVIVGKHHPAALLLCWAAWLEGVVTVLIDPALPLNLIEQLQKRCSSDWLFTDNPSVEISKLFSHVVIFDRVESKIEKDRITYTSWIEPWLDKPVAPLSVRPDDDAVILFTSGSTGVPKGVVLSQRSICHSGYNMAHYHKWDAERLLSLGPLSMMSGIRNPAIAALVSTSTILLPGDKMLQLPLSTWMQAHAASATVITAVPAWLQSLIKVSEKLPAIPSLSHILVTGASLASALKRSASKCLGVPIINYYGLTETGGICVSMRRDDYEDAAIGYPAGALVHIVDSDGCPVDTEQEGWLLVHSSQLMTGYLDDPDGTDLVLKKGWLTTGDRAYWDSEGRIWLAGRKDDQIKLGNGSRFYPQELEAILLGLSGVVEAAVTVLEPEHVLAALLVTERDIAYVRKELIGLIPAYWLPKYMATVDELPLGSNGKLMRSALPSMVRSMV